MKTLTITQNLLFYTMLFSLIFPKILLGAPSDNICVSITILPVLTHFTQAFEKGNHPNKTFLRLCIYRQLTYHYNEVPQKVALLLSIKKKNTHNVGIKVS